MSPAAASADPASAPSLGQWGADSLRYGRFGLFALFSWLLWGDFCFTLMETVLPSILPLDLKSLGASNMLIAAVVTTIPSVMNFFLNPVIGTYSDRYRSRRGRRIPFLLLATPFVSLFLVLLGFSREISGGIQSLLVVLNVGGVAAEAVTIGVVCFCVLGFQLFNLVINTIYWYLFNDVVPIHCMGRFLGLFRVVGALAGALYNFLVFRFAESHAREIFVVVAILYGISFVAMCLNVKEGSYPPPEPLPRHSRLQALRVLFRECFSHRIYCLVYFYGGAWVLVTCINTFNVFLAGSLGLTLDEFGKIYGVGSVAGVLLAYPAGMLIDRLHAVRVIRLTQLGLCFTTPLGLVFLTPVVTPENAFWVYAAVLGSNLPMIIILSAATLPMLMQIFPKEAFGQFCAANAMVASLCVIGGGLAAGAFLDGMKSWFEGAEYSLRFVPVWSTFFVLFSAALSQALFREWKKLGGDASYQAPRWAIEKYDKD